MANLISYLLRSLGGLIMFLTQRNREVRFHAAQSVALDVLLLVVFVALSIVDNSYVTLVELLAVLVDLIWFVVFLGYVSVVIYMAIEGYRQRHVRLPVVGELAERFSVTAAV